MKVLLFSNDLMPFGNLPTSGGGLRCWQIYQGLRAHGIEVIASMPGFTYLAEKHAAEIPEEQRALLWDWSTQDAILKRTRPDAVMFASNWDHYGLSAKPDVPLILDLHGSRLIETTMWNAPVSTDRKVQILGLADCIITAGERQRSYFYGWLVQAGRVPEDEHFIRYIPISLSGDVPAHYYPEASEPTSPYFVSGGGWFPWQDQSRAIFGICNEIARRDRGRIEIYGTPHFSNNLSPEEAIIRDTYNAIQKLSQSSDRIQVCGYVGRDDLIARYRSASVAVEVMRYNLERELAFTTRTVEYLWCGLPVLYNNYAELTRHISEYQAGWTIDPESPAELNQALSQIFDDPAEVARRGRNAQRLVVDRFSWDKTILPLVQFLRNPTRAAAVEPALGTVYSQPSFMSPRGQLLEIEAPTEAGRPSVIEQDFTVPAENIATVEVSYLQRVPSSAGAVTFEIVGSGGRRFAREERPMSALGEKGVVPLIFPWYRRPPGGTPLTLRIEFTQGANASAVGFRGLPIERFPYGPLRFRSAAASETRREEPKRSEGEVLALTFVPGPSQLYRAKVLLSRAYSMLKQGEWRRLGRALAYRGPQLFKKVVARALRA